MEKPRNPPRSSGLGHEDHMWLIGITCAAEDASKIVCAPYNIEVTRKQLEDVRFQLATALLLQLGLEQHARMDVVLSLKAKMRSVQQRIDDLFPTTAETESVLPLPTQGEASIVA